MKSSITSIIFSLICLSVMPHNTFCAEHLDLNLKNPAIDKLRTQIENRTEKIEVWKNKGAIGEEASGLLNDRQATGLSLTEKKEMRDLIVAENQDRYALFRELRIALNLAETELEKVAHAFAATRRDVAKPEQWIQNPTDKKWLLKKDFVPVK
jgi:hypothetical protein